MSRPKTEAATYKSLMLRLPERLLEDCKAHATRKHRSLNGQILQFLEICLSESAKHDEQSFTHLKDD